jgi:hypothetical protein
MVLALRGLKCYTINYENLSTLLKTYEYGHIDEVNAVVKDGVKNEVKNEVKGGKRKRKNNKTRRK